ncbi:RPA-C domain-containing protein [Aphelenchoides bicaudatus]|nr:RPA-C domain-containing protein [Aphelenchoides bicaudatus]
MDGSFDTTAYGNNGGGWGNGDDAPPASFQASNGSFDRIPLPISIDDIMTYVNDEDKFQLGKFSFGTVRVCGRIISQEEKEKETHLVLCDPLEKNIDDCNKIAVIVYQTAQGLADLSEDNVVVALGKLRTFGGVRSVVAFGIYNQPDEGLVGVFKLEAELAKRYYLNDIPSRYSDDNYPPELDGTFLSNKLPETGNKTQQLGNTQVASQAYKFQDTKPSNLKAQFNDRGFTRTQQAIVNAITEGTKNAEQGLHVSEITGAIGMQLSEIENDLMHLVNEGVVYNTMDDFHYAAI